VYIQIPQVVLNLIFAYNGRDFILLVPALRLKDSRDVGRVPTSEN